MRETWRDAIKACIVQMKNVVKHAVTDARDDVLAAIDGFTSFVPDHDAAAHAFRKGLMPQLKTIETLIQSGIRKSPHPPVSIVSSRLFLYSIDSSKSLHRQPQPLRMLNQLQQS